MEHIENLFLISLLFACFCSFVIVLLHKWGFVKWYDLYAPKWLPKEFCHFCLSFWLSVVFTIFVVITFDYTNIIYIFTPVISSILTRKLLS